MNSKVLQFPSDPSYYGRLKTVALEHLAASSKGKWSRVRASQFRKSFRVCPKGCRKFLAHFFQ